MTVSMDEIRNQPADENQQEYIQYAQDVEQALRHLEMSLHNSDDPEEITMRMLVAAAEFYDGDWAGIMEADLTMKVWSTLWWYNRRTNGMTPNNFQELEEGEYLGRWIEALMHGKPVFFIRQIDAGIIHFIVVRILQLIIRENNVQNTAVQILHPQIIIHPVDRIAAFDVHLKPGKLLGNFTEQIFFV